MDIESFGSDLRRIRNNKNISLKELGESTGFTKSYISMIENGKVKSIPQPETIKKIAKGLGVSHMELMAKAGYFKDFGNMDLKESMEFIRNNLLLEEEHEINISKLMIDVSLGKRLILGESSLLTSQESKLVAVIINKLSEVLSKRKKHLSYEETQLIEEYFDDFLNKVKNLNSKEGD